MRHKAFIRQASEIAARRCLARVAATSDEKLQAMLQASWVIWYDQVHMIPKILRAFPSLEGVIGTDRYGHATLLNAERFQNLSSTIVNAAITSDVDENGLAEKSKLGCSRN